MDREEWSWRMDKQRKTEEQHFDQLLLASLAAPKTKAHDPCLGLFDQEPGSTGSSGVMGMDFRSSAQGRTSSMGPHGSTQLL